MNKVFLFIIFILVSALFASGQKSVIRGKVTEAATGEGLPGANILYGRSKGTVSDVDGNFSLNLESGRVFLRFQYVGYRTVVKEILLQEGDTLELAVALEPDITQIDQVVVSAGRVEQRVAESTVSLSIIQPQQFTAAHISDSRELINKSPGIEVIDGQASVRGGSGYSYGAGSRVLTLIDGLPILAADAGSIRWTFLPLENVSQIEIIKGASSVLYGSSALNGVINFRTARPDEKGKTSFFAETGIYDNPPNPNWKWWGNTPRMTHTFSASHYKKYNHNEVGAGIFGVLDNGYRRLNHENIGRLNLNLRRNSQSVAGLEYGINTLAGFSEKRDFLLWENATNGALRQDESTSINLKGTFLAIDPFITYLQKDQYRHDLKMRLQLTDNKFPDSPANESLSTSILSEYQGWFNVSRIVNLNAGIYHYASRVQSAFFGNHTSVNMAAFLQADFIIGKRLRMVGGMRAEHFSLNGQGGAPVPLFRAGINYMLYNYTFLRASFGQGYRYPSIAEKHAATTLGAIRIFPNLLLQPESGWNTEVGIKQGVVLNGWDGMIDQAFFYSQNKDLIEYLFGIYPDAVTGLSQPGFRADNTEFSRVYGSETEFFFMQKTGMFNHTLSGGYVFSYPVGFNSNTGRNNGVFLKYRRKHSAKLAFHTRYKNIEPGVDFFYRSRILNIDEVFLHPDTREQFLPGFYDYWQENNNGYMLIDLNLAWHISHIYKISFAVKNLTNTEYMGRPGDIRPHRNFSLRISASF